MYTNPQSTYKNIMNSPCFHKLSSHCCPDEQEERHEGNFSFSGQPNTHVLDSLAIPLPLPLNQAADGCTVCLESSIRNKPEWLGRKFRPICLNWEQYSRNTLNKIHNALNKMLHIYDKRNKNPLLVFNQPIIFKTNKRP